MTDKVQKIRQEVVRMHNLLPIMDGYNISVNYADRICTTLEMYIDSLQEEPISNNLEKTSRNYADKEKFRKEVEKLKSNLMYGACSSQIAMETMCKEEAYNEVLAILDTMQEESKQCMYSRDNYTGEDRKVLCEGCEEKCEFNQVKESAILQHVNETCKENGDSLTQEPVSEDLGEYINELSKQFPEVSFAKLSRIAVRVAKWQKEKEYTCYEEAFEDGAAWKVENLWKPADGDDLPEIDREVIAILDNGKVGFAHRPPEYWDGKNIITGKVTRNYPKTYDKGGWNIPDVKFWLDVELPKEIEL